MTPFGCSGARRPIARNRALRGAVASLGIAWFLSPAHLAAQAVEAPPDLQTPGAGPGGRNIALAAGVLGGAFLLDETVRDLALDHQGTLGRNLAEAGHTYGDWKRTAPLLAGGGILLGVALDGERGVRQATSAFFGVFAGSMSNTILNWTLGRSRPRAERGVLHFDPFRGNASLGSGHTAYAFAIAAAVDEVTDGGWAIPFYAAAAGTGLARIYGDRHWLSDVVVGGFIGWWVGGLATGAAAGWIGADASSASKGRVPPRRVRVRPLVASNTVGVQIRFRE
ncbi:phosphatase PAP2 family protein [Candidatus Palauibacter sp.]|uniref:phosphatase PAP2 family protein n=1 Tax=Candidatus Palauibacter sp. TaxID=3101350 RepID=UPI003B020498